MYLLVALTIFAVLDFKTASCDRSDIGLKPNEMIQNHGYPVEIHKIITEDGYILTYFRIPHGIHGYFCRKPAVLLMHGISGSSSNFIATGPDRSLGYILADAGYDVWIANARGSAFSRKHLFIDPDLDPGAFYNFTWHEIGYYDLPAAIDYILELRGDDNLHFVGHSQGATTFLVLASTRPEYNRKIRLASLMAAAGILKHYPNIIVQQVSKYVDLIERILNKWKIYETPCIEMVRDFITGSCLDLCNPICDIIYSIMFSGDGGQIEKEFVPVIYSNNPSNTGLKQFVHFAQLVRDGGFRYFNYGAQKNLQIYGCAIPPEYDLSRISTPVAFYYGKNDGLITIRDEQELISRVPNVVRNYLVPYDLFQHADFIYAKDIVRLVYNEMMNVMETY